MRFTLIILLILLGLSACTHKKLVRPNSAEISYRQLLHQNEIWQKSIHSLDGSARLTLDTPEYSGNFSADILMDGSDSLLITLTGPMGIRAGKVFIAGNRFVFYNQVMNQFMTGTRTEFEDMNFMQFPLTLTQLQSVFAAQDRFGILKKEKFKTLDDAYYIETVNGTLSYHLWFDKQHLQLKKIEYYDGKQRLYYKEYSRFKEVNGVLFPHLINFVRPDEKQGFSIYFSRLELNEPLEKKRFSIKILDSAKQIDLSLEH